jgi:transketolase N-terminal domain/subunit
MAKRTIRQGTRYRATIVLGFLEQIASNELIASRFTELGFTNVTVAGHGANRVVEALWALPHAEGEVPAQVIDLVEI